MRFTTAWASVLTQNITLRIVIILLSFSSVFFCITTVRLAGREPLIVERACYSKVLSPVDSKHTGKEIEDFMQEAIPARFDSDSGKAKAFLSEMELGFRGKEQDDLSKKGMRQRVIVNSVKTDGAHFLVDTDRLISVGLIRSALAFPIVVELASTNRSQDNPYGLILNRVSQIKDKGDKNEIK